jgi:SAM-dependent methyltransferase
MAAESVKEFYDRQYKSHRDQLSACPNSLHDLAKARRRVAGVVKTFDLRGCAPGGDVLDVGSGLGYYTKALALTGAIVTGVDFSESAVEVARESFPECRFCQGAWPTDIPSEPEFDLIWTINFSLVNTFDIGLIHDKLVAEALPRLKPGGALVMGWNSDFSGRTIQNYSHWPVKMLRRMRHRSGFSAPLVVEAGSLPLSWVFIRAARVLRRSIPIFMVRRQSLTATRDGRQ